MTVKTDLMEQIRSWAVRPDFSDVLVDGFIRTAESNLGRSMRVKEMIVVEGFTTTDSRVSLPSGWREIDYIATESGVDLKYIPRSDFVSGARNLSDKYTIVGNYLYLGPDVSGQGAQIEISYYSSVPHLVNESNWLTDYYYDILLQACLVPAFMYALESDRASSTLTYVASLVDAANTENNISRVSGSPLIMSRNRGNRIG